MKTLEEYSDILYRKEYLVLKEVMRSNKLVNITAVAKTLNLNPSTVYYALQRLEKAGIIKKAGGGYKLSEEYTKKLREEKIKWMLFASGIAALNFTAGMLSLLYLSMLPMIPATILTIILLIIAYRD